MKVQSSRPSYWRANALDSFTGEAYHTGSWPHEGVDFAGNSLGRPTEFLIACAANPTADDLDLELRRVREKVDAGAHLLMTQPAYDVDVVRTFFERLGPIEIRPQLLYRRHRIHSLCHRRSPSCRLRLTSS